MTRSSPPRPLVPLGCGCATLRRASRAVTQLYDSALRPAGLRPTQYTLLQVLERTRKIRQADMAELLAIDSTTLSRTLKLLEMKTWIRSTPGEDQRESYYTLTPQGAAALRRGTSKWAEAQTRLRRAVGEPGWDQLLTSLNKLTQSATEISP